MLENHLACVRATVLHHDEPQVDRLVDEVGPAIVVVLDVRAAEIKVALPDVCLEIASFVDEQIRLNAELNVLEVDDHWRLVVKNLHDFTEEREVALDFLGGLNLPALDDWQTQIEQILIIALGVSPHVILAVDIFDGDELKPSVTDIEISVAVVSNVLVAEVP
jgi:hypothetical protein